MLNFNHVYYFHVVAVEGSIARAAEKLGVTQPTVSEQIRLLERALDKTLFERTSSGLRLTAAGRAAFAQTSVMFQAADRMVETLAGERTLPQSLRIGISASASRNVAADFLTPILEIPDCTPILRSGDSADLLRQLRSHELDLVLSEDPAPLGDDFLLTEIHRPRLVAIAAATVDSANGDAVWRTLPLITYLPESPLRWEVEAFARERAPELRILAETDDGTFMVEAAARGICIAVVPNSIARPVIEQKRVRVLATLPQSSVALNAVYPNARAHAQASRAVELLVAYAQQHLEVAATK